jgi:hypothetical protein
MSGPPAEAEARLLCGNLLLVEAARLSEVKIKQSNHGLRSKKL